MGNSFPPKHLSVTSSLELGVLLTFDISLPWGVGSWGQRQYWRNLEARLLTLWSEVKVTQMCPTLCDPMDYPVHGILQAKILEWGAFPFSGGSCRPGTELRSPTLQADSLPAEPQGKPDPLWLGSIMCWANRVPLIHMFACSSPSLHSLQMLPYLKTRSLKRWAR